MRAFAAFLLFGAACSAAPLGGPVPGYILDARTNTIRPVLGIPGALQLGSPLPLPFGAVSAGFDPAGTFAAAVSDEKPGHLYLLRQLDNVTIQDLGPVADQSSVLAVNGASALLAAPGQIQFLAAIGGTPTLSHAIPATSLLGPISAAALDSAGRCALLGTSNGSSGAFETLCADGTSQRIITRDGMSISAIATANQGADALLADRAGQQLLRVAGYAQPGATAVALAAASDGLQAPVGVQVVGQLAFLADAAAPALLAIDLSGHNPLQTISLNLSPTRLVLLTDRSIVMLNDPTSAPFTIVDLQAMQPFFIPTN